MKTLKSKKTIAPTPAAAPARTAAVITPTVKTPTATPAVKPTTTKAAAVATTPPRREITTEIIASRAYSLWEQRGRPQGQDLELWLQAEKQLASQSFAA